MSLQDGLGAPYTRLPSAPRADTDRVSHARRRLRRKPLRVDGKRRERIEAIVDRLLELLDEGAGDADLEDADEDNDTSANEPSLGWTDHEARYGCAPTANEFSLDAEVDDADAEPSLGACERHPGASSGGSQIQWAAGNREDLEGDRHEDDEPGGDEEPSLGSYNVQLGRVMVDGCSMWPLQSQVIDAGMDQTSWCGHGDQDLEEEPGNAEPALGWNSSEAATGRHARQGIMSGCEDEPSLGSKACVGSCDGGIEATIGRFTGLVVDHQAWSQDNRHWSDGVLDEREIEHEGGDGDIYGEI